MAIRYRFNAHTNDGRDISAVLSSDNFLPADQSDVYLLPNQGGFTCSGCRGFHFLKWTSHDVIQYNDVQTGGALSYAFPSGTFQQLGSFNAQNVGSGNGTLVISDPNQPRPVLLCTTMEQSSNVSWGFQAGSTFEQLFKAADTGTPTELGVRMGNNQNPYSVVLRLYNNNELIFERNYTGLKQRTSDWATVFDLSGLTAVIQAGAWVKISMTPDTLIGIEPIFSQDPNIPQGDLARYGKMAARFYMNGVFSG
jgi:hypothetical protein